MPIELSKLLIGIAIMAVVTYLCRVLTLVLVRKKIKNTFIRSMLTYIPFGVLSAMVFPEIIYSTSDGGVIVSTAVLIATISGTVVAIVLALFKRGLFTVAMSATATVLILLLILQGAGVP
ncbi:MAG: AzlD domain-containing protein [Clostridia bacterium]|nr:AzlD domain-containing protein [Clostridia bacterium]